MDQNLERFIRYVKIDTQSDENSLTTPSTEKQYNLLNLLKEELKALDIDSEIDEHGRLYAKLKGEEGYPTIGLNSHVDTASELTGKNVKPQLIENYDGGTIKLNDEYSMPPDQFPILKDHIGDTLVVTSGDTLLGGDDKAGLAIIMSVLAYFHDHSEIKHCPIAILFTPDEEIGRGAEYFDKDKFGADFAYTIDGDHPENIDFENFNAAHAKVEIKGISIHPGEAKGKLVNAITVAEEFDRALGSDKRPEMTEGYEGFYHLNNIQGTSESVTLHYIIRNHDKLVLEEMTDQMKEDQKTLLEKYPGIKINLDIGYDYQNMRLVLDKDPRAIEHARKTYKKMGVIPVSNPIRGGTDGATFSFLGCPCPNLGTGSYNHHGRYEFLSVKDFDLMIKLVTALLEVK